jgi:ribosomal protein S4E
VLNSSSLLSAETFFRKVNKTERVFKIWRLTREKIAPKKIVYIVSHDSKTSIFIDQDSHVNKNIMYKSDTKEIIDRITMIANSLNIVSDGSNTKRFGTIIHIAEQYAKFDLVSLNDARGHTFNTRIIYIFII